MGFTRLELFRTWFGQSRLSFVLLWTMEGARSYRIEMLAICSSLTEEVVLTLLKYASTFVSKMMRRDSSFRDHILKIALKSRRFHHCHLSFSANIQIKL